MRLMLQPRPFIEWALLFALVAMWGSSFMINKIALATLPPAIIVAFRLVLGAITLVAVVYAMGMRLPPFGRIWWSYTVLGMIGNSVPFYLVTWGQQIIESALAGILMGAMPLATLVIAYFVVHEPMTRNRILGFVLGFCGIVILMGPAAVSGLGGGAVRVLAQLAVLGGALCYATNSVLARLLIKEQFLVAAAGTLIMSSVMSLPFALASHTSVTDASFASVAAVIWLGVGPTAFATICYYRLISSAGPTFMSLVNYMSPAIAVLLGVALLGEKPPVSAYFGLVLILSGIALSQLRTRTIAVRPR
jgi:drug/metabolite transporter (DMT)-like permease